MVSARSPKGTAEAVSLDRPNLHLVPIFSEPNALQDRCSLLSYAFICRATRDPCPLPPRTSGPPRGTMGGGLPQLPGAHRRRRIGSWQTPRFQVPSESLESAALAIFLNRSLQWTGQPWMFTAPQGRWVVSVRFRLSLSVAGAAGAPGRLLPPRPPRRSRLFPPWAMGGKIRPLRPGAALSYSRGGARGAPR
jgi:hypothetical protein